MKARSHISILATALACVSSTAAAQPRAEVNFAFGGATTNNASAMDAFAASDQDLALLVAGIRAQGLDLIGVTQQLDFAAATVNDVNEDLDLFWLYAGVNNYLAGEQDPSVPPTQIGVALERLYSELGARRFVVPNLPALGDLPLFVDQPQDVKSGLNLLTIIHNQTLSGVVAQFEAAHPDSTVDQVDVFSIFQAHKTSGEFAEVALGCNMALPSEVLASPNACAGFLYLDIVHPVTAAWAPVAQAAADALGGEEVDRIITIGDSFSDLGSMSDTFVRAMGFPFPGPPFTEGRFSEAQNVVQQLEALVDVETLSTRFSQPLRASESFTETDHSEITGSVYVPKQIFGNATKRDENVKLRFETTAHRVECQYRYDGNGAFHLKKCNGSVLGGDLIETTGVQVKLSRHVKNVAVSWLYY